MKTTILLFFVSTFFFACNSQNIKSKDGGMKKPQENIKVTKKYDENGNLIELDSVYTSYYSNFDGDTIFTDTLMNQFSNYFKHSFNLGFSDGLYSVDSMFMPGFFHDDFFENQFIRQDKEMLNMIRQMDSLKNSFFQMHSQKQFNKK